MSPPFPTTVHSPYSNNIGQLSCMYESNDPCPDQTETNQPFFPPPHPAIALPTVSEQVPSPRGKRDSQRYHQRSPRASPRGQNSMGKHPVYRGVRCRSGKWVSEIREPRKTTRIWLGTYLTPEMAAVAYDTSVLALRSGDAVLNFPHLAKLYPIPVSNSPTDIQKAAAMAAAAMKDDASMSSGRGKGHASIGSTSASESMAAGASAMAGSTFNELHQNEGFVDEEELFDMPNLLKDMAGGMMISLPSISSPHSDDSLSSSDVENLWSYP